MNVDEFIKKNGVVETKKKPNFLKRIMAFVIDLIILDFFIFGTLNTAILKYVDSSNILASFEQGIPLSLSLLVLMAGIFALAYFTLLEYVLGYTIGMKILGLRVTRNPGFFKCVLRNVFILPIFPITLLWIIEPIYLFFKKKRLLEELTDTDTQLI